MNSNNKMLLSLIKKSQFGVIDDDVDYNEVDWSAVFNEAMAHTILGIIAPEVPENIKKNDVRWQEFQDMQMAKYVKYCYAEEELRKLLDESDIPFVILKGNASAIYYKNPERRIMGDIDFLVSQDMFEKTKEKMIEAGYKESETNSRHTELYKNGFEFELHHHFSFKKTDIEKFITDGLLNRKYEMIKDHEFPMLPKLANGLVFLSHMRYHMRGGLGLRHVIDWMMFVNSELSDEFWNDKFAPIVQELGLETFAITITRTCQLYLGLKDEIKWCKDADINLCNKLINVILDSGNFGRKNGNGQRAELVGMIMKKEGIFKTLQHSGEVHWSAYKKHHWLKPLCWFYQICRYLRQWVKTGRNGKQFADDIKRSNTKYDLLRELGI